MSNIKRFNKIIIAFIIIIMAMLVQSSTVQAKSMPSLSKGSTLTIGFQNRSNNTYALTLDKWLYCIDHGAGLSSYKTNKYTVKYVVTISGKTATCGSKTTTNNYNAKMAYIIAKSGYSNGYGSSSSKTTRQRAIWYYWNTWLSNSGKKLGISYSTYKNSKSSSKTKLNTAADTYANNLSSAITITGATSVDYGNYAAYKATFGGKIDKITITYTDGTTDEITKKSSNVKFYKDANLTNEITNITTIASKQKFYVKAVNGKVIKKMNIHVTSEQTVYTAKIYILKSNTGSQRLIAAKGGSKTQTFEADIDVKFNATEGDLKILKLGEYYENGEKATQRLANVQFKVYNLDESKWVKSEDGTASGEKEYVSSFSNATAFTTQEDGTIEIKGLKTGTYRLVEVAGEDKYYINPIKISNTSIGTPGTITINNEEYATVENVKISKGSTVEVKITDEPTNGDLVIEKVSTKKTKAEEAVEEDDESDEEEVDQTEEEEVTQVDDSTQEDTIKLQGAKIKIYSVTEKVWVTKAEDGTIKYEETDANNAQAFETDEEGLITLEHIKFGTYAFYEVETPSEEYDLTGQTGYEADEISKTNHWVYLGTQEISKTNNIVHYTATNKVTAGNLTIVKQDYTYNELKLSNAKIKIYSENKGAWITVDSEGKIEYTEQNAANATEFTTDEEGKIELENISFGEYTIYETEAPTGYDLSKQDGYEADDVSKENHWACIGTVAVDGNNEDVTYNAYNKKIVAKLQGYVWIDEKNKADETDNLYVETSNDKLIEDVQVYLYKMERNSSGNLTGNVQKIAETQTEDGHYEFTTKNAKEYTGEDKNIYYWELADCYVAFVYDNTEYIAVDPFEGTNVDINSKAQEYELTEGELNDQLLQEQMKGTSTGSEYPGEAVTYKASKSLTYTQILENNQKIASGEFEEELLSNTPLTGYYNDEDYTIKEISLGLVEKEDPDFRITEDLAYSIISLNGYEYRYDYSEEADQKEVITSPQLPTEYEQTSSRTFSAAIYPSDVVYNSYNPGALEVYVVYRIDIANLAPTEITDNLYKEQKMYLTSLQNQYDTERYELSTEVHESLDNENAITDFTLWNKSTDGVVNYDIDHENSSYKDGIESSADGSDNVAQSYIKFKMTNDAINKILTNSLTEEYIEKAPTVATASAYHEYLRTDNVWSTSNWENGEAKAYADHKEDSYETSNESGKEYFLHRTTNKEHSTSKLWIKFKMPEETRTISGTVFEDTATGNDDSLGDGKYDDTENRVGDSVKVELLMKNDSGEYTTAYLYQLGEEAQKAEAIIDTVNTDGTYEFKGVVPGIYYIRFTYGDGTQAIYDTEGNKVTDVYSSDYKSTIVTSEAVITAMEADDEENLEWYKYMGSTTYSVAVDNIEERLEIEGDNTYNEGETTKATAINAETPKTSITIENTTETSSTATLTKNVTGETDDGGESVTIDAEFDLDPDFEGFNLGIITMPKTVITLEKKITNIEIVNQVGTSLTAGNPKDEPQYISDLDKLTEGGSTYVRAEIDPDIIYGSALKTTYQITITNNSEADYIESEYVKDDDNGIYVYDTESKTFREAQDGDTGTRYSYNENFGNYYKYGDQSDAELKDVQVNEVQDYIDEKYVYDEGQSLEVELKLDGMIEESATGSISIEYLSDEDQTQEEESSEEVTEDGSVITTSKTMLKITGWESLTQNQSQSVQYVATSTLSSTEDDLSYENDAKIVSITLDKLIELRADYEWEDVQTLVTITPYTGENRSGIYWIAGAIALIVLASGIIVLKKKVLK